ncbi:uncharacterized protein LOC127378332 isoform X1 [Dicentrarchus labrax]|uniref:Immunoglobulin domain-containing protein n=1 Tax=Dicentrarchus labrax TaxID=13489 RepID=A0A8P4G3D2_DICLA|nr:uncharacterized protein LOC127378332 isoform X1 [Dicentrarchus labrax]XP_051282911.1 uncharacterized protein LOC127378332 isoform X1 [Dicentrarchus labrax]XP_051282913.1 uncharacterized protein LOC127378332 isoform X1 [Dicentrarchus labrax]XP_051282914.1 uncharacterized protein LOC127378332 isoform X1 [Dicentrarchus labrax]XP_051282915.1 uncharacterized protein LOC127378332 isoform X1 [Dicentrarchus labrax]XP_051282916.1 uncharacterized protein LOC127378332 isoform X1 [Dicentrarchus labrax]
MKPAVCGSSQSPSETGSELSTSLAVKEDAVSDWFLYWIMDLIWVILLVFLVCTEAGNLTEVRVELGHNATLNCSLEPPNIYWYMEVHSQCRALIIRTFTKNKTNSNSIYTTFISKYIAEVNRLTIVNATAEDCRLYFCARKQNNSFIFEDTFHLVSDVPAVTPPTNSCAGNHQQLQQNRPIWQSELILYGSFALNIALLVFIFIGLVFTSHLMKKKKNCNVQLNDPSPLSPENPERLEAAQYEEIQLPTYRARPPAAPSSECIYYKAQLPQSTLPQL